MFILDLLFGSWRAPIPARSRKYCISGSAKSNTPAVVAKVRIMDVLTNEWKTNKQIAEDAGLQLNTVQQKTAKLHKAGKIEKMTMKERPDIKPVCFYKSKGE